MNAVINISESLQKQKHTDNALLNLFMKISLQFRRISLFAGNTNTTIGGGIYQNAVHFSKRKRGNESWFSGMD